MDSSEKQAKPARPAAYAELLVDSADRYGIGIPAAGSLLTTSSDWRTQFQQNVLYGYFTRLAVTQIQFFWNLPTIITGYNDTLQFVYVNNTGQTFASSIVVPQGYYTPAALATAMQTLLQAAVAGASFTCTYNDLAGGFRITTDAAWAFLPLPVGTGVSRSSRFNATVGFLTTGGAPASSYIGFPPSMLATRFVDICSSYLTKYQRVKDSTTLLNPTVSNVIARVYPTAPNTRVSVEDIYPVGSSPFVLCIDYNTPKFIKWSPEEALANFDLQLRDEFGELLPFSSATTGPYGCEYNLTILASET